MTDSEKFKALMQKLKHEYEFYLGMTNSEYVSYNSRYTYKAIEVILAQIIEAFDNEFVRNNYRYDI